MLLLLLAARATTPDTSFPDTSVETPFPPFAAFVDRVPAKFVFDIPKDDEEVLLMFAQFVASDQVH